ncbi:hypothetical protein FKM82_002099 [Ascaphus truei]
MQMMREAVYLGITNMRGCWDTGLRQEEGHRMNNIRKRREVKLSQVTFRVTNKEHDTPKSKESSGSPTSGGMLPPKSQQGKVTPKTTEAKSSAPTISLRGLLAAQRITRELKNRAAFRSKPRFRAQHSRPITIINDQVPVCSANPPQRFPYGSVKDLIGEFLGEKLSDVSYEPSTCADLTKDLCEDIKRMVKSVTPPRYKLICSITIGSKDRDDIVVTSQCLWDSHSDNVTSYSYQNHTLFCVVLVYAVYCE